MRRNQSGFTLVEMLVSIVVGSLVTLAATTVLLLGLRINNRSTQTVIRQNTARVVITMLENLAADGEINTIETEKDHEGNVTTWRILNVNSGVLARFSKEDGAIYVGNSSEPMLDGIDASEISLTGKVLTIYVKTQDEEYKSTIYCRTMKIPETVDETGKVKVEAAEKEELTIENDPHKEQRLAFLKKLATQYRMGDGYANPGLILNDGGSTGEYYSEWYVGGFDEESKPGWGPETPWCACFISWGLNEVSAKVDHTGINQNADREYIWFASVDRFMTYFAGEEDVPGSNWEWSKSRGSSYTPVPGDIIFIDWDGKDDEGIYDPAHVGAVLWVEEDTVYTIEGNSTGGIVAVKSYPLDSPIIMGYGVLDWKKPENP